MKRKYRHDWTAYAARFKRAAKSINKDDEYIANCLSYAKKLYEKNLPVVYSQEHFSFLCGYEYNYILSACNSEKYFYRKIVIKKKNGGNRILNEPLPSLKDIQRWVVENILEKVEVHPAAKAYVPKKSIKDNARFHVNQNVVISVDIKDFFPSIHISRVYNIFSSLGYSAAVSKMLAEICCYKNCLPQGAPTSPYLSNIVMHDLDDDLFAYARRNGLRYTRYADDITFSGDIKPSKLIATLYQLITEYGFKLNKQKISVMRRGARQIVTGIVVNQKMQFQRVRRKKLRQDVYYINKYGLNSHCIREGINKRNYLSHLIGVANSILFINPNDKDAQDAYQIIIDLLKDESKLDGQGRLDLRVSVEDSRTESPKTH
ncbi:retron St85 family RNA-directed DNA polymerase [Thalassospira xiamenensis]|uniref:retron St85 family RNA-directed DNA polymerase n=1 Tax=Thalassospira xiamenensis TaxID=220697 RepID=UPI001FFE8618|nr:retron St85 family RNA-directed DNA polymerase [Thalassospira xiamenensis]MCK2167156.1 retron St85 family RNA-directed DNA polymerase [Thalassospira xiamenensis]